MVLFFKKELLAFCLLLALTLADAHAACPAPDPGETLPPEAKAEFLADPPWRARVAALDQIQSTTDLSAIKLLFLGDSITEAWDSTIFSRYFSTVPTLNLGVRGDTTQGMLWRLSHTKLGTTLRPELIVLLIGTNDTWPGGNARAAAIGVGEVVRTIQRMAPGSRLLLLGILPRGPSDDDPWRRMATGMNHLIAGCADDRSVFYAEPGSRLVDKSGTMSSAIAADYLHPTPQGYAVLGAALDPIVRKLLR